MTIRVFFTISMFLSISAFPVFLADHVTNQMETYDKIMAALDTANAHS